MHFRLPLFVGFACLLSSSTVVAQSRIMGDQYSASFANFDNTFGITCDPVLVPDAPEFFDFESLENDCDQWTGDAVNLTFDGIAEPAGGLMVNERVVKWEGKEITAVQAATIDGQDEFVLPDWETEGEVLEFSFETIDKEWLADDPEDQSFYTLLGLDWANSDPGEMPFFLETGFYFYYSTDGVPVEGYETQLPEIGLLVGEHPFDDTIKEVVYIGYSRGQVNEVTKAYEGGFHITGGTTQLDENDASWAALLGVMGVEPAGHNGLHVGILVEPPTGQDIVFENGDTDLSGAIDVADIDLLAQAIRDGLVEDRFDLNDDSNVDLEDHRVWVKDINNTWFGDSDLNGEFDSADFVLVFQAGLFELDQPASWAQGDWDGNGRFDSSDFVKAFQDGGYELGPRGAPVPEPHGLGLFALLAMALVTRRQA